MFKFLKFYIKNKQIGIAIWAQMPMRYSKLRGPSLGNISLIEKFLFLMF
jgi:hypothetical protein